MKKLGRQHQTINRVVELGLQDVEDFVKDAFNSAGERDIYTGDYVLMYTITKDGSKQTKFELKFD